MMQKIKNIRPLMLALLVLTVSTVLQAQQWNPNHAIGTITGKYHFTASQVPDQLVELHAAGIPNTGLTYQWESSTMPTTGFTAISGATASSYSIPSAPTQTRYYRRATTRSGQTIRSNTVKIQLVTTGWEDINYVRQHSVAVTGVTTAAAVDGLPIGQKLQTTSYVDGIGRPVQMVSRETATTPTGTGLWGDQVKFAQYDVYGRQTVDYLPYTTTSQSGKFKTSPLTEQQQYYTTNYNESSAFTAVTFDNSPYNRLASMKKPGTAWAAGTAKTGTVDMNAAADNVIQFVVGPNSGDVPYKSNAYPNYGVYPNNTLLKIVSQDENGKKVIEYMDMNQKIVLRKVQLDDNPTASYDGWICTYSVYDEFGRLRCQIQPEGVKYLSQNSWTFAGTTGATVLAEQTFQYFYDEKSRLVWKKAPGTLPERIIYDIRNRVVYTQTGNQATLLPTPQWTMSLYDELDRPIATLLYTTSKTEATLKSEVGAAPALATLSVTNTGNTGGGTISLPASYCPVNASVLNDVNAVSVLSYQFYDNYAYTGAKSFNTSSTNTTAYPTSDPNVIPIARTFRTANMPTGGRVRVMGTNTFLAASIFYDERGQAVQIQKDNVKAGVDIVTYQYHFDGRILSSCTDHSVPSSGYTNFQTLTKFVFDKLGRVTSIDKKYGSNAFKTVSTYAFDDMNRVKSKLISPGYTAGGNSQLESLIYSYNLHGSLVGINKDYALKAGAYSKWDHFFGMYLGYDNRDNQFTSANLTGRLAGQIWSTQGDNAQRRFEYSYDNAGRVVNATFREKKTTGDSWNNTSLDYSTTGSSGKITYDLNGNLQNLLQKGVIPGTAAPVTIDNLVYTYDLWHNKLKRVADQMTIPASNGKFGDFKDGTNTDPDYVYDNNGNVVIDLNKDVKDLGGASGVNGIRYNFLNKPEEIRIAGKGKIRIVYNGGGEVLQRIFTPEPTGPIITTSYINEFVYQESSAGGGITLQYITFEEGRIRVITPFVSDNGLDAILADGNIALPNGKEGVYDYYVMDHQQNVRMILTEGVNSAGNTCTMETARATLEQSIFGQAGAANEVSATRFAKPAAWTGNTTASVSRLGTTAGFNVGPNALQKVMAGDKISASTQYYYTGTAGGNNTNFLNTVVTSLLEAINDGAAANSLIKSNASSVTTQLSGVTGFVNAVQPGGSNPGGNTPQAYLTMIFFDERFNFIPAAEGGVQQVQVAASVSATGAPLALPNVKAPKNGYVYVYISNQSNNHVYFDDFKVSISTGNIIEENHYYSYGLKIATLSSKRLGTSYEGALNNNFLYQGGFSEMDGDIGWQDFALRSYDPQIGRWMQHDPFDLFFDSPYAGMGLDPANNIDPTGGVPIGGGLSTTAATAVTLTEVVVRAVRPATQAAAAISVMSKVSLSVRIAYSASSVINTSISTQPVGTPSAHTTPSGQSVMLPGSATNVRTFSGNEDPASWSWSKSNAPRPTAEQLNKSLPAGTLERFTIGGDTYSPVVVMGTNDSWIFKGYRNQKGEYYKESNFVKESDFEGGSSVTQAAIPLALTLSAADGPIPIGDAVGAAIVAATIAWDLTQRTYVTYVLTNPVTQQVYVGRTSGYGTPHQVMMRRFYSHSKRAEGFSVPELDRSAQGFPVGYWIIRGREQQLLDSKGGVGHPGVRNDIRAVNRYHPLGRSYHEYSSWAFGELHEYTGGIQ